MMVVPRNDLSAFSLFYSKRGRGVLVCSVSIHLNAKVKLQVEKCSRLFFELAD